MAPNADFSRLRNRFPKDHQLRDVDENSDDDGATQQRITQIKNLSNTEVAIDGSIFDLTSFKHPGGDSVLLFGGNDVTIQYKMIHPYHTKKQVNKMKKVGIVTDYKPEYKFDSPFHRELLTEVAKIVRPGQDFGTVGYLCRAAFYCCVMAFLQGVWVKYGSTVGLAIALGVSQASIGLNVQHDANHGAASRDPWVNDLLGFGADFIGGSKWLWMEQHWTHHAYCNHNEMDPDAVSAEPMLLFNDYPPNHPARKFYHRYQAFFFLPILSFYWLSSVFNTQILDLQQKGAASVGFRMDSDFIKSRCKFAIGIRALYIYMNCVTPFFFHAPLTAFGHIMLLGIAESLTLSVLFSLSHNFEHSDRDPTKDFRESGDTVCWYKGQAETSSTYGGFISGCLTGGLNFQIEHHLFPRMCSAWYPFIAPTVRRVCEKHGVRYAYYPWVWQNFISTVKYMHKSGTAANWELDPLSGK